MNIAEIFEYIGAILILIGAITSIISAIGIIRFRDIYSRSHAATKTTTLAVLITLTGTFIFVAATESYVSVRLTLGIIFVFITAPVSGHLVLRAAYRSKTKMTDDTVEDELYPVLFGEKENRNENKEML